MLREHNKEADLGTAKGVKGREDEWVDTGHVVWSEVTGLCVFSDGSCDDGKCGVGIMIQAFRNTWLGLYLRKMWACDGSKFPGC